MTKAEIYTVGGTVQAGDGLYIPRRADDELLALCRAGTFAYVLSSRQMGKSSLMVRTVERLADEGSRCVSIDLNAVGVQVTPEQWYLGLLTIIESHLALQTDTIVWWQKHRHLGVTQRLTLFFQSVLLAEIAERVVIFIDEIDTTLSLAFTDDFYAAIRSLYNVRAREQAFQRLAFVLIGVATPSDLIGDSRRTPFNIGQRVDVTDFTFEEALPLAGGLGLPPAEARQVLQWIMEWTGGHPYLTQRLCSVVALQSSVARTKADVERTVANTFFGAMSEQDQNLQFVRDMLTKGAPTADRASILLTYREIRLGFRPVRDEEQSVVKTHLKLSGVVRRDGAMLRVRNLIYATVFDITWIKEHLPANWTRAIYTVGGTVQAGDGLYIARKADKDLLGFCLTSDYAYVFGPPQTGKSSLMVHTVERLADEEIQAVVVSLDQLGVGEAATAETWYPQLLSTIADQLLLDINVANWWQERPHLSISQRLTSFFQEVVLVAVPASVVIFFDEVQTTFSFPFAEDLYAAVGYLHRARAKVPLFRRISFVLIGTAHQSDLIRDPQRTPLAIERQVDLTDWTEAEALPLAEGLGLQADAARRVLRWVLDWTGGHPYLTQRLCQAVTAQSRNDWSRADLDRLVAGTFFDEQRAQNHNLRSVDDILTAPTPNRTALLATYREIRRGKRSVPDDEQSPIKERLKLSGAVRAENGVLRVRNPIYEKVFDNRWARAQLPSIWGRRLRRTAVALFAVLCLAAICLGGLYAWDPNLTRSLARDTQQTAGGWVVDAETFIGNVFSSAPASETPAQPSAAPSR